MMAATVSTWTFAADLAGSTTAYVPFKMPLNALQDWWYLLLIPLAFGIAFIYKSIRVAEMRRLWSQTLLMTAQIILSMIALAVVLAIFVLVVIPMLPVE